MRGTVFERLEKLGRAGFTVSIAFGPAFYPDGGRKITYSVDVVAPDGEGFERPYVAESFLNAVQIAEQQISERGWRPH